MTTIPESPEVVGHRLLMMERIEELEAENLALRSGWLSVMRRIEAVKATRRRRYVMAGALVGVLVGWVVDGSVAQVLDRMLRAVGL